MTTIVSTEGQQTRKQQSGEVNLLSWKTDRTNKKQKQIEQLVVLANGEAIFMKQKTQKDLMDQFIYSKMIGVTSSSKNVAEFVSEPYLIDKYSCAYVLQNKIIGYDKISNQKGVQLALKLQEDPLYKVFKYLIKQRELYLVDGHKFGGDFLAYQSNPDSNHATYLVFVQTCLKQTPREHVSRLAGLCKKIALILTVKTDQSQGQIIEQEVQPKITSEVIKQVPPPMTTIITPEVCLLKSMLGWKTYST